MSGNGKDKDKEDQVYREEEHTLAAKFDEHKIPSFVLPKHFDEALELLMALQLAISGHMVMLHSTRIKKYASPIIKPEFHGAKP